MTSLREGFQKEKGKKYGLLPYPGGWQKTIPYFWDIWESWFAPPPTPITALKLLIPPMPLLAREINVWRRDMLQYFSNTVGRIISHFHSWFLIFVPLLHHIYITMIFFFDHDEDNPPLLGSDRWLRLGSQARATNWRDAHMITCLGHIWSHV